MGKLTKAQERVMNNLNNTLAVIDKYETFEDFFDNSKGEQNSLTTGYHCGYHYNTVEKYTAKDPKAVERMRANFYQAKTDRILLASGKTETIKKLEKLGLIEIVEQASYESGFELVKVLE